MIGKKRFGVALSGGGYRAAAFHIGTLKKLNELGLLSKVDVLSTISGGSITGAVYCLHKGDFQSFEKNMIAALSTKSVIRYVLGSWLFLRAAIPCLVLLFTAFILPFTNWSPFTFLPICIFVFLVVCYQFRMFPLSHIIEKAYDEFFCISAGLDQLCDQPELAIGSTNLQTMRHFTFSKRKMEDSAYAYYPEPVYFNNTGFPVAKAVMASTCVPFAFTPVSIHSAYFKNPALAKTVNPKLVDGGVYDNQGIHKITQNNSSYSCDIVLVSDAGNKVPFDKSYSNTFTLLLRTVETFMIRIKNFQMMQSIYIPDNKREVAYQSLGWDVENCIDGFYANLTNGNITAALASAHGLTEEWIKFPRLHKKVILDRLSVNCKLADILDRALPPDRLTAIRKIGTNLTTINADLLRDMIIHAENLTEIQLRLYSPSSLKNNIA